MYRSVLFILYGQCWPFPMYKVQTHDTNLCNNCTYVTPCTAKRFTIRGFNLRHCTVCRRDFRGDVFVSGADWWGGGARTYAPPPGGYKGGPGPTEDCCKGCFYNKFIQMQCSPSPLPNTILK